MARWAATWNRCVQLGLLSSFIISLVVTLGAADQALAHDTQRRIASVALNKFDLAFPCRSKGRAAASAYSRFGFAPLATGGAPEFVYIVPGFYVELGPHDDHGHCKFRRYLYRLDEAGAFKREEIGEKRSAQLLKDIVTYEEAFDKSHPGQRLRPTTSADGRSVGGCLFPIFWDKIGNQTYALLSITDGVGIAYDTVPNIESTWSCNAWGDRSRANASIISGGIDFLSVNVTQDLIFVESPILSIGFLFKPGLDFQCLKGNDSFSEHILISQKLFDLEVRPYLDDLIKKRVPDWLLSQFEHERLRSLFRQGTGGHRNSKKNRAVVEFTSRSFYVPNVRVSQ
jgi:hypothetical protein